jgi:hypothetical protein
VQQLCGQSVRRGDADARVLAHRARANVAVLTPAVVDGGHHTNELTLVGILQQLLKLPDQLLVTPSFDELDDS